MQKKKGISLIVLVITIIVMIILAAAIILSLNNAGIIGNANQAVFKQNIKNYLSELDLYYMDALIDNSYANTKNIKATATTNPSITDLIPSMSQEDKTKFRVAGENLIYIGANRSEYEWCRELGIIIDSTNLSEEEYNNLYKEEIAYAESVGGFVETFDPLIFRGGYALDSTGLIESEIIVIPYGYESLAYDALADQTGIKEIILPSTIKAIGSRSLYKTGIENIVLPEGIETFDEQAFYYCTSLKEIDIPNSLDYIGLNAFDGCVSLQEINIPKNVTYIGDESFSDCTVLKSINVDEGNTRYMSEDGILYNKTKTILMSVPGGRIKNLEIPNTVTTIATGAASGCTKIKNVQIPASVTTIGLRAFEHCESLESIVFPDSVTNLGSGVLEYCYNLTAVKLPSKITKLEDSLFSSCKKLTTLIIPSTVQTIGGNLCDFCYALKTVYIESTILRSVGNRAFVSMPTGSIIYVRNADVANALSGKYTASKTTISADYNW